MRGRIVAGGYKQMKLESPPIAADINEYVELTVRLAKDAELRAQIKEEIKTAAQKYLFDDQEAADEFIEFTRLFDVKEGRVGVVVSLIAILELVRQKVLELVQAEDSGPIHIKATTAAE